MQNAFYTMASSMVTDSVISAISVYYPSLALDVNGSGIPVSNFDEDALTMACHAAFDCLERSGVKPDHVMLCSNSLPSWPVAGYLLDALALPQNTPVSINTGSWRSAIDTLHVASQLASSGNNVLLIASEQLTGFINPDSNLHLADASCALLVTPGSNSQPIFRINGYSTVSDIFEPLLVGPDGKMERFKDARFTARQAVSSLSSLFREGVGDDAVALSAFDERLSGSLQRLLQFKGSRHIPVPFRGYAGCVQPFLALAGSEIEEGKNLHLIALGAGASSITLVAGSARTSGSKTAGNGREIVSHEKLRRIRSFMDDTKQARQIFSSQQIISRDRDLLLRLKGKRCSGCGRVFTLPVRVCSGCHSADNFETKYLSRNGSIFTFTHEYYVPAPVPPVTMVAVDLDGGGRMTVQATDSSPDKIKIGAKVRLVLRRYHSGGGMPNYFWKAITL